MGASCRGDEGGGEGGGEKDGNDSVSEVWQEDRRGKFDDLDI